MKTKRIIKDILKLSCLRHKTGARDYSTWEKLERKVVTEVSALVDAAQAYVEKPSTMTWNPLCEAIRKIQELESQ